MYSQTSQPPVLLCKEWRKFAAEYAFAVDDIRQGAESFAHRLSTPTFIELTSETLDLQSGFGEASEDEDAGVPLQSDIVRKLISQIPRASHLAVRLLWYHAEAFISELMQEAPLLVHIEIDGEYGYNPVILWIPTSPLSTYGLEVIRNSGGRGRCNRAAQCHVSRTSDTVGV
ncbi:hypothetical protein PLEOSDRAFT_153775 [Pleurotus ostreatus PC15]|uniref:Uncharacterized protein n=1 Tax=Pleurotus ostreatus (strain PC15) TaxID=1137138 RepID=A0A067P7X7_PLEO1|nr:hypothetical protein PLEOSDRAFT_153775 [Pleurotus ostreatus PC15]